MRSSAFTISIFGLASLFLSCLSKPNIFTFDYGHNAMSPRGRKASKKLKDQVHFFGPPDGERPDFEPFFLFHHFETKLWLAMPLMDFYQTMARILWKRIPLDIPVPTSATAGHTNSAGWLSVDQKVDLISPQMKDARGFGSSCIGPYVYPPKLDFDGQPQKWSNWPT